jgi:hypothetical protein
MRYFAPSRMRKWKEGIELNGVKLTPEAESIGFIEVFETVKQMHDTYGEVDFIVIHLPKEEDDAEDGRK